MTHNLSSRGRTLGGGTRSKPTQSRLVAELHPPPVALQPPEQPAHHSPSYRQRAAILFQRGYRLAHEHRRVSLAAVSCIAVVVAALCIAASGRSAPRVAAPSEANLPDHSSPNAPVTATPTVNCAPDNLAPCTMRYVKRDAEWELIHPED